MPSIALHLTDGRTTFAPHETVTGTVSWALEAVPQSAELQLLWRTSGRGSAEESLVETVPFATPQANESRPFTITLPDAPYSFSGSLITLTWWLEAVLEPGGHCEGVEITMAPEGKAIGLPRVAKSLETV
jgi:hypothetical protein